MNRNTSFDFASQGPNLTSKKTRERRLFKKEISLICIVGLVGCIGTLFVFNKSWFPEKLDVKEHFALITISKPSQKSEFVTQRNRPFLEISGDRIIDSELVFQIKNYNPNATYKIDFGDGQVEKSNNDLIHHTYSTQGNFQIELKMLFRAKESVVYNRSVEITDPESNYLSSI